MVTGNMTIQTLDVRNETYRTNISISDFYDELRNAENRLGAKYFNMQFNGNMFTLSDLTNDSHIMIRDGFGFTRLEGFIIMNESSWTNKLIRITTASHNITITNGTLVPGYDGEYRSGFHGETLFNTKTMAFYIDNENDSPSPLVLEWNDDKSIFDLSFSIDQLNHDFTADGPNKSIMFYDKLRVFDAGYGNQLEIMNNKTCIVDMNEVEKVSSEPIMLPVTASGYCNINGIYMKAARVDEVRSHIYSNFGRAE